MAGIIAIVNDISADVNAALAAAGLPALSDGGIVVGRAHVDENSDVPRVIFIPKGSRFEARSTPLYSSPQTTQNAVSPGSGVRSYTMTAYGQGYTGTPTATVSAPDLAGGVQATATVVASAAGGVARVIPLVQGSGYLNPPTVTISGTGTGASASANLESTPQARTVAQQRSIRTDVVVFEVHVWNANTTPDPNTDFDACQALYQQVILSAYTVAPGIVNFTTGRWVDSQASSMQVDARGRVFVFGLEIDTPVTATPLQFANPQVQANPTTFLIPFSGGTPEQP